MGHCSIQNPDQFSVQINKVSSTSPIGPFSQRWRPICFPSDAATPAQASLPRKSNWLGGEDYFWKIDYYDRNLEFHSPDPADPSVTVRVLTILRVEEY